MTPRSCGSASKRLFARHFAEMVVVMLLGMGVLEGLAALTFAAAGSSLADQSGALRVMLMGFSMTIPMVAWMAYRRHRPSRNAEMAASMLVPSVAVAALAAAGVFGAGAALVIQHGVMVPAMLGVMLWRYEEYALPDGGRLVTTAKRRTQGHAGRMTSSGYRHPQQPHRGERRPT